VDSERYEPRWPASLAVVVCAALYVALPSRLSVGPKWLLPVLVALLLVPLSLTKHRHPNESSHVRRVSILLIAIINLANVTSMILLVHRLLDSNVTQGRSLIYSAVSVWATNVIVFALWFWEIDRGGPHVRGSLFEGAIDFQFPQMQTPEQAPTNWRPRFIDYLYLAFTNATSFAPADAMPFTGTAKALMASESIVSLITVALVAARAVNILN